jgi:integrase
MDEIDLPYLAWPKGRGGIEYPTYRRDGLLRQLKTPDGDRLRGPRAQIRKDTRVIAAWLPIHDEFEKEKAAASEKAGGPKHKAPWVYNGSIAHAMDGWLEEEVPFLAPGTRKHLKQYAAEIRDLHGHRPANSMPRDAVVKMVSKRALKTPGAAQNLLTTLRSVFLYVEDHRTTFNIPANWQNPCYGRRKRKRERTIVKGWAPWEEWMIRDFRKRWRVGTLERVLFEVYLATGQRGSDVAAMKREHYHDGKIAVVQAKTGARVWIPVLDDLIPVLTAWLRSHTYEVFFPNMTGKGINTDVGEPLGTEWLRMLLIEAIDAAGLPKTCKPHGLRYTFATRAIELGVIEKRISHMRIASIVGHRTLAMAIKYTEQQRDSELVADTMNRGLAAYEANYDPALT